MVATFTIQAKAYSKNQCPLNQTLEDISWLKRMSSCSDVSPDPIAETIFCMYVFVNILILIFTVQYSGKVYTWIEIEYFKDLYKASAIVLTFINLSTFIFNTAYLIVSAANDSFDSKVLKYFIIKYLLVILIFILDIIVTYHNTHKYSHIKCKIMYTLALCQIIWFVHRLATYVILFIFAFLLAPAQALGILAFLLTVIFFTVLFVTSLLKQCQAGCNRRSSLCNRGTLLAMLLRIFIIVCTAGLVTTVIYLFIILVKNGLHSAGLGGLILSFVTPTIFFVIGLYINRETVINFYHHVLSRRSTSSGKLVDEKDEETGITDGDPNTQTNDTMTIIHASEVSTDMEGSEVKDPDVEFLRLPQKN